MERLRNPECMRGIVNIQDTFNQSHSDDNSDPTMRILYEKIRFHWETVPVIDGFDKYLKMRIRASFI